MQQAYLSAYRHFGQFADRAKVSTWLTTITVYEALGRVRDKRPTRSLDEPDTEGATTMDTAFQFHVLRCDQVVVNVLTVLRESSHGQPA